MEIKLTNGFSNGFHKYSNYTIKELFVDDFRRKVILKQISSLPKMQLNVIDLQWLQVLSEGWAYPLDGFMRENEYLQTLHFNTIREGNVNQSVPIVLAINDEQKLELDKNTDKALSLWYNGKCYAFLSNYELYPHRKEERCCRQFGKCTYNISFLKFEICN